MAPADQTPARQDAPARPSRRRWLWGAAVLFGLAVAGLIAAQVLMTRPPLVAVETATLAPVTRVLAVNGRIAAVSSVEVTAPVTGTLVALPVAEGDKVTAGQLLAQVDAEAQRASVRQAQAAQAVDLP